jgi:hypothetical protein
MSQHRQTNIENAKPEGLNKGGCDMTSEDRLCPATGISCATTGYHLKSEHKGPTIDMCAAQRGQYE